ncbi:MAG: putative porin [Weeksellaceae bacterium]
MRCIFLFILLCSYTLQAQLVPDRNVTRSITDINRSENDSILGANQDKGPSDSLKVYNPTISDYKTRTAYGTWQSIDTALTIDAYYRKNEYQRDLFTYQEASNAGLSLNPLTIELPLNNFEILPVGKSFMYKPVDSVTYYNVKTPTTTFIFENGDQEGQFLSTTFSHNIHSRWNYTINYNYLKSMGRYLNQEVLNTSFLFNSHYTSKSNRYQVQSAFISHDLNNNENGGLTTESLQAYKDNNSNFTNRRNMFHNLQGAYTKFDERRIQLQQKLGIISWGPSRDSLVETKQFPIYLKHQLVFKHQDYDYFETKGEPEYYFDAYILSSNLHNRKKLDNLINRVTLGYQWSEKLNVEGGVIHQFLKPYYDNDWVYTQGTIPASTTENRVGLTGNLLFNWKDHIAIHGKGEFTRGDVFGNAYQLNAKIEVSPISGYHIEGGVNLNAGFPHLNYFYNQSFYDKFNYYNKNLDNQSSQELYASISSEPIGLEVYGKLQNINNYTYLDKSLEVQQATDPLQYFMVGVNEQFKFGKFGTDLRFQFQKVIEQRDLYPVPDYIARATIYYEDNLFNNAMHLMTGISGHYFSEFNSRAFFPILNDFNLQPESSMQPIGNYPQVDIFLNMKVRRMRIYLRGQNISSFLLPGQNLYTPNQPSKDFKIQLGIHWFLFS